MLFHFICCLYITNKASHLFGPCQCCMLQSKAIAGHSHYCTLACPISHHAKSYYLAACHIYTCVRTGTCHPCSPPYPASTLPLTGESCFSEEGASNLQALRRSCLHEVTPAKTKNINSGLLTFVPFLTHPFFVCLTPLWR